MPGRGWDGIKHTFVFGSLLFFARGSFLVLGSGLFFAALAFFTSTSTSTASAFSAFGVFVSISSWVSWPVPYSTERGSREALTLLPLRSRR